MARAAGFCFNKTGDKILMILVSVNGTTYWSLPGGTIEEGESPEDAFIREVKEETNCTIKILKPLGSHQFKSKTVYFFLAQVIRYIPKPQYEENIIKVEMKPVSEAFQLIKNPVYKKFFKLALDEFHKLKR